MRRFVSWCLCLCVLFCSCCLPVLAAEVSPTPAPVTREDLEEIIGNPEVSRVYDFSGSTPFNLSDMRATVTGTFPGGSSQSMRISNAGRYQLDSGLWRQDLVMRTSTAYDYSNYQGFSFTWNYISVKFTSNWFNDPFPTGSSVFWSLTISADPTFEVYSVPAASGSRQPLPVLYDWVWQAQDAACMLRYVAVDSSGNPSGSYYSKSVKVPIVLNRDPASNLILSMDITKALLSVPAGYAPVDIAFYGFATPISWSYRGSTFPSGPSGSNVYIDGSIDYSSTLTVTPVPSNVYYYLREILASLSSGLSGPVFDNILARLNDIYADTQSLSGTVALIPPLLQKLETLDANVANINEKLDSLLKNAEALDSFEVSPEVSAAQDENDRLNQEQGAFDSQEQKFSDDMTASLSKINFDDYNLDVFDFGIAWVGSRVNEFYEALGDWKIFFLLPLVLGIALAIIGGIDRAGLGQSSRSSPPPKSGGGTS